MKHFALQFVFVLALSPAGVGAQSHQPRLVYADAGLGDWSDLQWMQWLLQAEEVADPEPDTWPPPPDTSPSEGTWLRLDLDRTGISVIPNPAMALDQVVTAEEQGHLKKQKRVVIGVSVALAVVVAAVPLGAVAATRLDSGGAEP